MGQRPLRLAVVDLETTGLDRYTDEIVDVAAVLVDVAGDGSLADVQLWSTAVHPRHDDLPGEYDPAPAFAEVADAFIDALAGRVLVLHNAGFDRYMIAAELHRAGRPFPPMAGQLDTAQLVRRAAGVRSRKLSKVCARLGVDPSDSPGEQLRMDDGLWPWHTATFDAWMTWRLLAAVVPHLPGPPAGLDLADTLVARWGRTRLWERHLVGGLPPRRPPTDGPGTVPYDVFLRRGDLALDTGIDPRDEDGGGRFDRATYYDGLEYAMHPNGTVDHVTNSRRQLPRQLDLADEVHAAWPDPPAGTGRLTSSFLRNLNTVGRASAADEVDILALVDDRYPKWRWLVRLGVFAPGAADEIASDRFAETALAAHRAGHRKLGQGTYHLLAEWAIAADRQHDVLDVLEQVDRPGNTRLGHAIARVRRSLNRVDDTTVASMLAAANVSTLNIDDLVAAQLAIPDASAASG